MAPVQYIADYIADPESIFHYFWDNLPWERREDAPRRECWMTLLGKPYTYGRGAGERTYHPVKWNDMVEDIQLKILQDFGVLLEGCFCNGYEGPRDHLGWHADDSIEIDHKKPIAVVSFGATREIWFRKIGDATIDKQVLEPGSLLLMEPGMQQTHQHRIPKNSAMCAERVSLTFRGLIQ